MRCLICSRPLLRQAVPGLAMQCKDIPDAPVLAFLRDLPDIPGMPGVQCSGTWYWRDGFKPENSVLRAMPTGTPEKLGLAKMRMLIRRGLVDGCPCGCRGDFTLTAKGRASLAATQSPA